MDNKEYYMDYLNKRYSDVIDVNNNSITISFSMPCDWLLNMFGLSHREAMVIYQEWRNSLFSGPYRIIVDKGDYSDVIFFDSTGKFTGLIEGS